MVKSSILFALLLGVILAQMIPAHPSNSDDKPKDSDIASSDKEENPDAHKPAFIPQRVPIEALSALISEENPSENCTESSDEEKNIETKSDASEYNFELAGFDRDYFNTNKGELHEIFETEEYTLIYNSEEGNINFHWRQGRNQVDMFINSSGGISQRWDLRGALISLERGSKGSITQIWDFDNTEYTCRYRPNARRPWSKGWAFKNTDPDNLKKYKNLIDEWCDKNDFLLGEKKQCVIYPVDGCE